MIFSHLRLEIDISRHFWFFRIFSCYTQDVIKHKQRKEGFSMKKDKALKIVTPIIAGVLLFTPLTSTQAVGYYNAKINSEKSSVLAPELLPVVTANEAESGLTKDGQVLPNEFLVKNNSNPMARSASLGYEKWSKVSTTRKVTKGFLGWHPGWKNYQYNISYYYFSKSKMSVSLSIGYGYFGVSVSKAGGNGQMVKANPKKWTRPAIYGNVNVTKWNVKKYNGAGIYTGSKTKYTSAASSVYVASRNK